MTERASLLTEEEALEALLPEWTALWERTPAATPFQHPAWALPWWRAFHPGRLRVVALRDGCTLTGLLPLYEDGGVLRLLGAGVTDVQDALLPGGWGAAPDLLAEAGGGVVTLDLPDLPDEATLRRLPVPPGWREEAGPGDVCPVLEPPSALPAAMRRELRHARARAERRGPLSELTADSGSRADLLEGLYALHDARWRARGEPGVLADPRVRAFHREATDGLLRAGLLRLQGLAIGGTLAAVHYGLARAGRWYYYLGGFDPELAAISPGTLAVGAALEAAVRAGAGSFNFLRGREAYKYRWGAEDRPGWRRRLVLQKTM